MTVHLSLVLRGELVNSRRSARSRDEWLDFMITTHPDKGCRYGERCLECTHPFCKRHETAARVRK